MKAKPTILFTALLFTLLIGFAGFLPVHSSADNKAQQLIELCAKKLKISAKSKDPTLPACVYGYTLAANGDSISKCDKAYDGKAAAACKNTGYPLGKSDPLNIGDKNNQSNGGKGSGNGGGTKGSATVQFTNINAGNLPQTAANNSTINNLLRIVFGIIGAFALLNIVSSGMKYITSAGNEQRTSEAKKGIAYALVGLAIAITAEAIVTFVVHRAV